MCIIVFVNMYAHIIYDYPTYWHHDNALFTLTMLYKQEQPWGGNVPVASADSFLMLAV